MDSWLWLVRHQEGRIYLEFTHSLATPTGRAMTLTLFISGNPAPQGSKRYVGRGIMVEACKRVKPWRDDIRNALTDASGRPLSHFPGAVVVTLDFVMPRPKSTPKRTPHAVKKPDLDKLIRAVFDAVTSSGVWIDDSQVVAVTAKKRIAESNEATGVCLMVKDAA